MKGLKLLQVSWPITNHQIFAKKIQLKSCTCENANLIAVNHRTRRGFRKPSEIVRLILDDLENTYDSGDKNSFDSFETFESEGSFLNRETTMFTDGISLVLSRYWPVNSFENIHRIQLKLAITLAT